jgi:hypothetical protein
MSQAVSSDLKTAEGDGDEDALDNDDVPRKKVISKIESNNSLTFLDIRRECIEKEKIKRIFSMNFNIPGLPLKPAPQIADKFKRFAGRIAERKIPFRGRYYFENHVEAFIAKMTKEGQESGDGWNAVEEIPQPKFVIVCEMINALLDNPSFEELVRQRKYTFSRGAADTHKV